MRNHNRYIDNIEMNNNENERQKRVTHLEYS